MKRVTGDRFRHAFASVRGRRAFEDRIVRRRDIVSENRNAVTLPFSRDPIELRLASRITIIEPDRRAIVPRSTRRD